MREIKGEALWEGVVFFSLASVIIYLLYSKLYLYLVTPKATPFLVFAAVIFYIWSGLCFCQIQKVCYKNNYKACLPLLWILIILVLPLWYGQSVSVYSMANEIRTDAMEAAYTKRPVYQTHAEYLAAQRAEKQSKSLSTSQGTQYKTTADGGSYEKSMVGTYDDGIDDDNRAIVLQSHNFYNTILKIYKHIDQYKGYEITMTGFISKDDRSLVGNEFVVARILMICCIADVAPFGLVCEYDGQALLPKQWYTVRGIIDERSYRGQRQPYVHIKIIQPADPIDGFVYPY